MDDYIFTHPPLLLLLVVASVIIMTDIHDWIINDIRLLQQCDDVNSVIYKLVDNQVIVMFDLSFDVYAQAAEDRVRNPESIQLVYINTPQLNTPKVLAARDGFPRDLPHLNPTEKNDLPSICLWRKGGTATLYKQKGIIEVVHILQQWLEDASLKQLEKDGWEPSPRSSHVSFYCNIPKLQSIVVNHNNSNSIYLAQAKASFHEYKENIIFGVSQCNAELNKKNISLHDKLRKTEQLTQHFELASHRTSDLKVVIAIPPIEFIDSQHNSETLSTIDDLRSYGNYDSLITVLDVIERELLESKDERGVIVILAHRRPYALIPDIHGLSEHNTERSIELVPFFIHRKNKITSVKFLSIRTNVNSKVFSDISGCDIAQGKIGIVGCGSLGSTIADQLARSGYTNITLWDSDCLEAHNAARHICSLSLFDIPNATTKAYLLGQHIKGLSKDHEKKTISNSKFFELNSNREFCREALHLIDATASDLDRYWHQLPECAITRLYISDEGRIGLIQTQPRNAIPDMLDLDAKLYLLASQYVEINTWLSRQRGLSSTLVGLSCSSETLKLPWSTVLNHASALLPSLKKQFVSDGPLLGVNLVDESGTPLGYKKLGDANTLKFQVQSVIDNNGTVWRVSISDEVVDKISRVKREYTPREAGGYILGLYNIESHRISIVFASKGKFESTATSLSLEPIDNDVEALDMLEKSCNMLVPLGTWHSHPNSTSQESPTDIDTYNAATNNPAQLLPFVMLIQGNSKLNILVGYNKNT